MKKNVRKLRLHRETLRNLTARSLGTARGGNPDETSSRCIAATGCECETETGCPGTHLMTQPCTLESRCIC